MTAPRATSAQLRAIVERALAGRNGAATVIVHADPAAIPELVEVGGRPVSVRGAASPLAVRALLRGAGDGVLVVLTDCEARELGDDVLARTARRRLDRLDRWTIVCQLFGAERPTRELARRAHLADALIEARPLDGYPRLTTRVLDIETALAALLRVSIGIADDVDDLAGLVRWASRPEHAGRIAMARPELLDDLRPALSARFGPGADAVVAVVAAGRADELAALGAVAATVHAPPADDAAAIARLDEWLGRPNLSSEAYRRLGDAVAIMLRGAEDAGVAAGVVERADGLLRDLGAAAIADRSDLLPSGFDLRLRRAAEAISTWRADVADPGAAAAVERAIADAAAHERSRRSPERVERLRMASRLVRRGSFGLEGLTDLAAAGLAYEADGAWLDAARTVVSRGDADAVVGALLASVTAEADTAREHDGRVFADLARHAGAAVPAPLVAVEHVLDRVVAPLAETRRVVLVVLDGLGWTTFTDLVGVLEGGGWVPWRQADVAQVGVAALPTVTEVSRASLLAGTLRTGSDESEQRAFRAHDRLVQVSMPGVPPALFHKRHLRHGGLDTRPADVLDAIADERQRVVGVVLNNIDERLKDVAQPADRWDLRDLEPLGAILDEARRAGLAVVLTADHGHVLDRDAEVRTGGGGGERWRPSSEPVGDGEVLVSGSRVVTDTHEAVLPWREQLRYGLRRNGYHGGLTPKELLVPVVVLSTDDLPTDRGWSPSTFHRPAWWHHQVFAAATQAAPMPTSAPMPEVPTLFDQPAPAAAAATLAWLDELFASERFAAQLAQPRVRLGQDEVRRLLEVLDAAGTMAVPAARLADAAGLPVARIDRYVAQLQDLLNVDGYGVVTAAGGEVRFDRALLARQFQL